MSHLSPKQREIRAREQSILAAAQAIWRRDGYQMLTMERVAETIGCSKGTLYNHFSSKEDLACTLCCQTMESLLAVFQRAARLPLDSRSRFLALGLGYALFYQQNPDEAINIQTVKSPSVREKLSEAKRQQLAGIEKQLHDLSLNIVHQAIEDGDLPEAMRVHSSSIVFSLWAMHYGGILIDKSDIPLRQLGYGPVVDMLWYSSNHLLDGYHWRPLGHDEDENAQRQRFEQLAACLFDAPTNAPNADKPTLNKSDKERPSHG